jgi:hypothetical protein
VTPLYVYALVDEEPPIPESALGAGLAGEPLALVRCGGIAAVAGGQEAAPPPSPETLARHDEVVRRLAAAAPALLPARFGQWVRGEAELRETLAPRAGELTEALALVRGCVQMTLRVFGETPGAEPGLEPAPEETGGPGTRYLAARRQALERARSLPEISPLREALQPLLRAERIERVDRYGAGRLLGTAYHLVPRDRAAEYLGAVEATGGQLPGGWRVAASGPWPPYAFGPGGIA